MCIMVVRRAYQAIDGWGGFFLHMGDGWKIRALASVRSSSTVLTCNVCVILTSVAPEDLSSWADRRA